MTTKRQLLMLLAGLFVLMAWGNGALGAEPVGESSDVIDISSTMTLLERVALYGLASLAIGLVAIKIPDLPLLLLIFSMPIVEFTGLRIALCALQCALVIIRTRKLSPLLPSLPLALFLLCVIASVGWSLDPGETLLAESTSVSAMVLQLPLTIAVLALLRTGLSTVPRMLWSLAAGCIPGSLLTVFNALAGVQWKEADTGYFMGLLPPDIFSPMLVMGGIFLLTQVVFTPRRRSKMAAVMMLAVISLGIVLAGIRSGWIAFLASSLFLLIQVRKPLLLLMFLAVGGILAAIAFAAQDRLHLGEQIQARFSEKSMHTGEMRMEYWEVAARGFLRRPILGIGWGSFPGFAADQSVGREAVTHNVFIRILCELGLVGFGMFWLWIIKAARKSAHTSWGVLITSLMVATLTQGCFLDHFICSYFWLFLGICDGTRADTPVSVLAPGEAPDQDLEARHISLAT